MFRLNPAQLQAFADAVFATAGRADFAAPLAAIYKAVADAVDARQPKCSASGACCQFDAFDHSLFVTTIEVAAFVAAVGAEQHRGGEPCPYQIGGRCSVHSDRPFGCRIFYCDPSATEWQTELYSQLHGQLQELHDRLAIPYFYVEWRQALAAIDRSGSTDRGEIRQIACQKHGFALTVLGAGS